MRVPISLSLALWAAMFAAGWCAADYHMRPAKFADRFDAVYDGQRPAMKGDLEAAGLAAYHRNH